MLVLEEREGASHGNSHTGHRLGQEYLQLGRRRRRWVGDLAPADASPDGSHVRRQAAELRCGDGGVLRRAPSWTPADSSRTYGEAHVCALMSKLRRTTIAT